MAERRHRAATQGLPNVEALAVMDAHNCSPAAMPRARPSRMRITHGPPHPRPQSREGPSPRV